MSAQSDEAMRLLREWHAMLGRLTSGAADAPVAPDADLDGTHGNPTIRAKSPRDWTGEDQLGLEFFNTKETDEKKRGYNARGAARARGWAARLRAGWTPKPSAGDWAEEEKPTW